jgi:ATP-dependent Lhr-like helicase
MPRFDLHPRLEHHIPNTLGWSSLREVQKRAIKPIRNGANTVLLAPTAGGKTEAALFPVLSELMENDWNGLSILYVSPLRALLNNQFERMEQLLGMVGYEVGVWHGDVSRTEKRKIKKDPPDALLTTPESLEVILVSQTTSASNLFGNLRVVVIDEVHSFAEDDRGWHLLGVLERLTRWADRDLQRLGLSATIGNPDEIAEWMSGNSERTQRVVNPPAETAQPKIRLDWVGTAPNAARIVSQVYKNTRTLVFCESRLGAEKIAKEIRARDINTYLNHSSLSRAERRRTERNFREPGPGIIVATSALELGIDIGDLDHVVQLEAPNSVASLLQRLGRSGRREGEVPNITLLATEEQHLLRGAALIDLWERGFVESARAPAAPYHILAQQILASVLERPGVGLDELTQTARDFCRAVGLTDDCIRPLLGYLVAEGFLFVDGHRVGIGREGEETFGARHFLEIVSVFTTPPVFTVKHHNSEIGTVHQSTFTGKADGERSVVLLGGRSWLVTDLDWDRRIAYVEQFDGPGSTTWIGGGMGVPRRLAEAHRDVLLGNNKGREKWTDRATKQIEYLRNKHSFLYPDRPTIVHGIGDWELYSFLGNNLNSLICDRLSEADLGPGVSSPNIRGDGIKVTVQNETEEQYLLAALRDIGRDPYQPQIDLEHPMLRSLKFRELLPNDLLQETAAVRSYGCRRDNIPALVNAKTEQEGA